MTATMRAAVAYRLGEPLRLTELPVPTPGRDEVLVEIHASGVCHTDLHAVRGDWPVKPALPFVPGHEGAGIVVALGPGVEHLRVGDAVGIAWLHDACGRCEHCIAGWESLCERQRNSGYSVNGTFAQYALAHAGYVARLPRDCDFAAIAPILCAGVTSYKGIRETGARPGQWLLVSGIGGLGHLALQYAQAMGLRTLALDVSAAKLELAHSLGAEAAIDAASPDAVQAVLDLTGGGAHGVLVTAVAPPAFSQAVRMVRRRGTVSLVGLPPGEFATPIFEVVLKRITLRGSIVGGRQDLAEAVAFAADGKVRASIERFALDAVNEVFDRLQAGRIEGRAVLDLGA